MVSADDSKENGLLAALPLVDSRRWLPYLEPVEMSLGKVLYEPGTTTTHVYFPTTSIVSLLYVMEDGASAEIAVVGRRGHITVLDRAGLERRVCECYAVVKNEYDRLLPGKPAN
jgi:hypothetical protein